MPAMYPNTADYHQVPYYCALLLPTTIKYPTAVYPTTADYHQVPYYCALLLPTTIKYPTAVYPTTADYHQGLDPVRRLGHERRGRWSRSRACLGRMGHMGIEGSFGVSDDADAELEHLILCLHFWDAPSQSGMWTYATLRQCRAALSWTSRSIGAFSPAILTCYPHLLSRRVRGRWERVAQGLPGPGRSKKAAKNR
jgi:hypothetical protein